MGRRGGGLRRWIVVRARIALLLAAASCASPDLARAADACGPGPDDPAVRIAAVSDTFDVGLEDGRTLRLAGVDVPRGGSAVSDARRALELWAGAGPVAVHAFSTVPDRWGRIPALLYRSDAAEPSAAAALLVAGLVRARPEPAVHPCFDALLAAEDAARTARRGLWADREAVVLRADDADGLARASGGLAIVQGILQVHAARGGTLYLTLGRDRWGFAAVLTPRDAARLAKGGFDIRDYVGTPVRLRGDLDDRFGARLRLTDPDQVQSLEPGSLDAASPPSR